MAALTIVGGGRMGAALADGLIASGWAGPDGLSVVEALPARRAELVAGAYRVVADVAAVGALDGVVLAVKPGDVEAACASLAGRGVRRLVSVAAGIRIEAIEGWLAADGQVPPAVIRAMPNTPALVGAGASALAPGPHCDEDDRAWASSILAAVGTVTTVTEPLLDAVTGLSGSGPAYVFLLVEALVDAGVLTGLTRTVAQELAVQTVVGAGRLLAESGEDPAVLRAAVTSPGGTTAAGLHALEAGGLRATVASAVLAATARARELGG